MEDESHSKKIAGDYRGNTDDGSCVCPDTWDNLNAVLVLYRVRKGEGE